MVNDVINKTLIEIFESATMNDGQGGKESLFLPDKSDINYEFEDFHRPDPTVTGCWYELHFLPATPYMAEIFKKTMNRWTGIFQINVCVPKTIRTYYPNLGVQDFVDNAYNSIAEVMKRGVIKDRVHITGVGRTSAIDNGDYYSVPISVSWYANLPN